LEASAVQPELRLAIEVTVAKLLSSWALSKAAYLASNFSNILHSSTVGTCSDC